MNMRVLLIEDHADLAANVADFLSASGHAVSVANDGHGGLELARTGDFDAVVLDRLLPGLDGTTVCRRLRSEATNSQVPVLMLTALDTVADKLEGFAAGADDYLVKPFALVELRARLDALQRRARTAVRVLRVADLEYDLDTLIAQRAGRTLTLNPTQRTLLELLMRNTHRVVTRGELEAALWGDEVPDDDILRVHIYTLRQIVDRPFPQKLLCTVHGIGYRLTDDKRGS